LVNVLKDEVPYVNIGIGHILSLGDAAAMRAVAEKKLDLKTSIPINEMGITIGTHAGPGALAVAYCRKYSTFVN